MVCVLLLYTPSGQFVHKTKLLFLLNIVKKYLKDFKELKSVEKTNFRILMTKGEVFNERKKKLEEMNITFKKLQTHVEQLSDLLDEDIPQLQVKTIKLPV